MATSNPSQARSSAWKQRLKALRQNPSSLSAIASLGVHGLLFAILPFLPATALRATEPEIRRPVDMVELTPQEQQRLPDFSTYAPIQLPPIADPPKPNGSDLFTLAPAPTPNNNSPSTLDSLPPLPPLPIFIPPAPPAPAPSFTIPITPTAPPETPQSPAPSESPQAAAPEASSSNFSPSPSPNAPDSPAPSVAVEPGPESPSASPQPNNPDTVAQQPSPSPRSQEQIRQDLIAQQKELRELYAYNPSGTSVEDANLAFGNWFREVIGRDLTQGDEQPEQQELVMEYPKLACPLKQSRNAVVGVLVDAENKIVGEPKVLQSSGYRLFNQKALQAVSEYSFENTTGQEKPYLIRVEFEYSEEICPPGFSPLNPADATG